MDWATALTSVDLGGIADGIVALVPLVLPTVITLIGIRKGISFLVGQLSFA